MFKRDSFTCRECRMTGVTINAHHIKSFAKFPELRLSLDNGITLCENCHIIRHKLNTMSHDQPVPSNPKVDGDSEVLIDGQSPADKAAQLP